MELFGTFISLVVSAMIVISFIVGSMWLFYHFINFILTYMDGPPFVSEYERLEKMQINHELNRQNDEYTLLEYFESLPDGEKGSNLDFKRKKFEYHYEQLKKKYSK